MSISGRSNSVENANNAQAGFSLKSQQHPMRQEWHLLVTYVST